MNLLDILGHPCFVVSNNYEKVLWSLQKVIEVITSDNPITTINDKALLKLSKEFAIRVKKKKWGKDGFLKWDRPYLAKKVISVSIPGSPVSLPPVPLSPVPITQVPLSPVPLCPVPLPPLPLSPVPLPQVHVSPVLLSPVPMSPVPQSAVPLSEVPPSSVPISTVPVSLPLSAAQTFPVDTFDNKFIEI